jgi:hypothetical protein
LKDLEQSHVDHQAHAFGNELAGCIAGARISCECRRDLGNALHHIIVTDVHHDEDSPHRHRDTNGK